MFSPLGGDLRGGLDQVEGGNAAWNITTIGLNSIVYLIFFIISYNSWFLILLQGYGNVPITQEYSE